MSISGIRQSVVLSLSVAAILSVPFAVPIANAAPDENQEGRHRGPPAEAFEACANVSENAVCSFEGRRGVLEGVCVTPRRGDEALVCKPSRGRPDRKSEKDAAATADHAVSDLV